jgi:hypothetical protein
MITFCTENQQGIIQNDLLFHAHPQHAATDPGNGEGGRWNTPPF